MSFLITKSIQQTELKRGSITLKNHFPFPLVDRLLDVFKFYSSIKEAKKG